jgi:phosphoribosylformimino-5-aminoimidazole carboxamide ribotide isomerase
VRIIPVMDLQDGRAVRGRGGDRGRYQPVVSRLRTAAGEDLSDPAELLSAYLETLRSDTVYVADLNRLEGRGDNDAVVARLLDTAPTVRLLVDGGFATAGSVTSRSGRCIPVLGTESLRGLEELRPSLRPVTGHRPFFSLDLDATGVVAHSPAVAALSEVTLLRRAARMGVGGGIVLMLRAVGTGSGIDAARLQRLRRAAPALHLLTGGGIACIADLEHLRARGWAGALLATALHDRRILAADLLAARLIDAAHANTGS